MRRHDLRTAALVLAGSLAAGCSGGGSGSPLSPAVIASPSPTPGSQGIALSSSPGTSAGATPPGATGSAPPATGAPSAPPTGTLVCTAATDPVPGYYASIATSGNVVGSTYTENPSASNSFTVSWYGALPPTPPPPTPIGSSVPTANPGVDVTGTAPPPPTPLPTPPPVSTPTPNPNTETVYVGTYFLPPFNRAAATTGCFSLAVSEPAGSTTTDPRRDADGPAIVVNASGSGYPNVEMPGTTSNGAGSTGGTSESGRIVSFTIVKLEAKSGHGTFVLKNGVVGTVTITGSYTTSGVEPVALPE